MLPNDETFVVTWLAITRIGAVAVTLSTLLTPAEIRRTARHADLHLLIAAQRHIHHDYVSRIAEAIPGIDSQRVPYRLPVMPYLRAVWFWGDAQSPDWAHRVDLRKKTDVDSELIAALESEVASSDPACIIYTSGSTNEPKGVIHTQGNIMRQAGKLAATYDYLNNERAFASLPFFWVGGLTATLLALMQLGATVLASAKSGAALLDFLEHERTTSILTWPHILRAMAAEPSFAGRDWSAMRGGRLFEALPIEKRPKDITLAGMPLGMTETAGPYTIEQRRLPEERRGSMGPLMPGVEGRLIDPENGHVIANWAGGEPGGDSAGKMGVMEIRSDVLMLGLVKRERFDVFTPDGWYSTGDLCSFRDGHLYFHGRVDDMIKSSGANVSPREVEAVLLNMTGIAAAHVSGVPDRQRGTVVGAVVIPKAGFTLDADQVRNEAGKSLSSYKVPRVLVIAQASNIPMMSSGKVDRRALIEILKRENGAPSNG